MPCTHPAKYIYTNIVAVHAYPHFIISLPSPPFSSPFSVTLSLQLSAACFAITVIGSSFQWTPTTPSLLDPLVHLTSHRLCLIVYRMHRQSLVEARFIRKFVARRPLKKKKKTNNVATHFSMLSMSLSLRLKGGHWRKWSGGAAVQNHLPLRRFLLVSFTFAF